MIFETTKDIIDDVPRNSMILVQTNSLGFGTHGVLQRILREYPSMFNEYHSFCGWFKDRQHQEEIIGSTMALRFPDKDKNAGKIIACCFALRWITPTKSELCLDAWKKIARKIATQTIANHKATGTMYQIHIPKKIGVGLMEIEQEEVRDALAEVFRDKYPEVDLWYHL